jgi:hypothetical protein
MAADQNMPAVGRRRPRIASQQDGETKLIIDYGHEETATIEFWQIEK